MTKSQEIANRRKTTADMIDGWVKSIGVSEIACGYSRDDEYYNQGYYDIVVLKNGVIVVGKQLVDRYGTHTVYDRDHLLWAEDVSTYDNAKALKCRIVVDVDAGLIKVR